ncbi:MAG TPA: CvpA family protein [Pyrinomonadaceae bacterium]|jgi:membrane protein required for colicin V production|nr:CvpA family protein [Pyrinomonadaceae bacterium]
MTIFDLFVLAIVGSSVVAGALRGFVRALIALVALAVGLVIAAHGYWMVGALLRGLISIESDEAANAGGFLLIMCAALVLGFAAGSFARTGLRRARLEWFDRVLGAGFGFVRGLAVCSAIYLALTAFPVRLDTVADAATAPALIEGARLLAVCTSADVRARFISEYKRLTA